MRFLLESYSTLIPTFSENSGEFIKIQSKISGVIHFAAFKSVSESIEKPVQYYRNNVCGLIDFIELLGKHNIHKFVFSSSATVYRSKAVKGKHLREEEVVYHEALYLDEFNNETLAELSVSELTSPYRCSKDGIAIRDFIHVTDLARGHVAALSSDIESPFRTFNLGTGNGTTVAEAVKSLEGASLKNIAVNLVPRRIGDVGFCVAANDRAKKELGWTAKETIQQFSKDLWNYINQPETALSFYGEETYHMACIIARPTDSAYASMSTGGESSITPLSHPILTSTQSSKGEVEDYLRDIPDGLYPQRAIMTDRERKSLVVRRLEQLFTGRDYIADTLKTPFVRPGGSFIMVGDVGDGQVTDQSPTHELPTDRHEPIREARILPLEQRVHTRGNDSHLRNSVSPSHPCKDSINTGGNDEDSVPATRPCDLDPDRAQVPYENMDYIRHLDLLPAELLSRQQSSQGVDLDAEGWVSLNLLYNLAQLHLINVTPDFVRSAVSENSTILQLSTDGHKVLWQGGSKDTNSSSYSSDYDTPETPFVGNIDKSEQRRDRQKTSCFTNNQPQLGGLGNDVPAFDPQVCARVESFRYEPLFALQNSSWGHNSRGGSVSSDKAADNDKSGKSRLGLEGYAGSADRRQHHEGAITYYSNAPFCIDLAGDPTNVSRTACTSLNSPTRENSKQLSDSSRSPQRTTSRSYISYTPPTGQYQHLRRRISGKSGSNSNGVQDLMPDSNHPSSYIELDPVWTDDQQDIEQPLLEPCGLGVLPHDHFRVVVDTKRPKHDILQSSEPEFGRSKEGIKGSTHPKVATQISGSISGGSETKVTKGSCSIGVEYLSWRTERLVPVPLPSPVRFFPPLSTDSSMSGEDKDLSTAADDLASLEKDTS
ncbi:unnamed protein product [Fusarium graminearum]|nr:unnamed protein product [Fusarium graminearum]